MLLALYELSKRTWSEAVTTSEKSAPQWNDFYQLDGMVDRVLRRSGYYHKGTPLPIPGLVKALFRRMDPDDRELRVLVGMFSRLDKVLNGEVPLSPKEGETQGELEYLQDVTSTTPEK